MTKNFSKRRIYGVFIGKRWGLVLNKSDAIKIAKKEHGVVRSIPYSHGAHGWDAPTFQVSSRLDADFRIKKR